MSSPAQPRCGTCEGCTRTEDCGQCSKCSQGKRPCYQRTCWTRKRENERRAAQRRAELKKNGTTGLSRASSQKKKTKVSPPAPAPPTREDSPGRSETKNQEPPPPTSPPDEDEPSQSSTTQTEKCPPAPTSTPAQPLSARNRRRKTEAKSEDSEWSSRVETGEKKARPKKENPKVG